MVATALQDALVQDYDGLLRIAPAWPADWTAAATVAIQHRGRADVQVSNGVVTTVVVEAGADGPIRVRNPWAGQQIQVVDGTNRLVVRPTAADVVTIPARAGHDYLIEPLSRPTTGLRFAPITGTPATEARLLGPVSIGLPG